MLVELQSRVLRLGTAHGPFPAGIVQGLRSSADGPARSAALRELETFVHQLFIFQLPASFFIQNAVAVSLIVLLLLAGFVIIFFRILQQKFWVVRVERRSEGSYIVPNALNSFLLFVGIFGVLWVAFVICQYMAYWRKADSMQNHIQVMNLVVWMPVWFAAYFAGWGSFYTAPGALERGIFSGSRLGRFLPRPLLINILSLGTPFALVASLVPPIVLGQRQQNHAFGAYLDFSGQVKTAIDGAASIDLAQVDQFLSTASRVWDLACDATWYEAVAYTIWSVWAGLLLLLYLPAGGYLSYLMWDQVRKQRENLRQMERRGQNTELPEGQAGARKPNQALPMGSAPNHTASHQAAPQTHTQPVPLLFQPLSSSMEQEQDQDLPASPTAVYRSEGPTEPPQVVSDEDESNKHVFYPPLRSDARRRALRPSNRARSPASRYRYIRRCLFNLLALYIGISCGTVLYMVVAALLAGRLYEALLKGPAEVTKIVEVASLMASWVAVVFGFLTVTSVFARFLDPANMASEDDTQRRSPAAILGRLTRMRSNAPQVPEKDVSPHERTRTLPAVPESVHQTQDMSMIIGATTATGTHSKTSRGGGGGGLASSASSARRGGARRPINFDLVIAHDTADGIVIQPSGVQSHVSIPMARDPTPTSDSETRYGSDERLNAKSGGKGIFKGRWRAGPSATSGRHTPGIPQDVSEITTFDGITSQTESQRSFRSGKQVYYPTPFGPMQAPAPPRERPLAPMRSPPRSPRDTGSVSPSPPPSPSPPRPIAGDLARPHAPIPPSPPSPRSALPCPSSPRHVRNRQSQATLVNDEGPRSATRPTFSFAPDSPTRTRTLREVRSTVGSTSGGLLVSQAALTRMPTLDSEGSGSHQQHHQNLLARVASSNGSVANSISDRRGSGVDRASLRSMRNSRRESVAEALPPPERPLPDLPPSATSPFGAAQSLATPSTPSPTIALLPPEEDEPPSLPPIHRTPPITLAPLPRAPYVSPAREPMPLLPLEPPPSARKKRVAGSLGIGSVSGGEVPGSPPRARPGFF